MLFGFPVYSFCTLFFLTVTFIRHFLIESYHSKKKGKKKMYDICKALGFTGTLVPNLRNHPFPFYQICLLIAISMHVLNYCAFSWFCQFVWDIAYEEFFMLN